MGSDEAEALRIVEAALEREGAERAAFIGEHCSGSATLEARVRAILAMEDARPESLSTRVMAERHRRNEAVPERIGKFRVVDKIGEGGMGLVVRAERDDGVYSQSVAIKLIRGDLRDERARERFANERRLLARLSHPSIARILDGGEQDGHPYLVMELVDGRPVTEALRDDGAGLAATLAAFDAVAEAVSHAHRNLVIHGDIKPANVMRTAEGVVKLLDFGIGRLVDDLDPQSEAYPLTPAFSAPERLRGEPPGVAGDVYSLGVLLHLMLAGTLPGSDGLTMSASADGSRIAPGALRGDLDAIAARALAPDPASRYSDVASLQLDLRRHASHQPISARPATIGYVAGRFLRRNRLGAGLAAAFMMLLLGATAVSSLLYFDAQRQRAAAVARFEELRSLAKFQIFELYDRLAETPGTTAARAALAAEAQHYLDRLAALPDARAGLRLDVARGLDRLASVQGTPRIPNLGQPTRARANLARAAALLVALAAEAPADAAVAAELAHNRILRAQMATWLDFRTAEARRLLEAARPPPHAREVEAQRRSAWLDLLSWEESYADLRTAAENALAWLEAWPGERPLAWHLLAADARNARGDAFYYLGDSAGALASYRAAEAALATAAARWPRRAAILARQTISSYNVITTRSSAGETISLLRPTLDLIRRGETLIALEPNDEALRRRQMMNRELAAQLFVAAGQHGEAVAQQRRVVADRAAWAARSGAEPRSLRDLAFSRSVLGTVEWNAGRRDAACGAWREAAAGFERLLAARQLNAFDRERNLSYLRRNLEICSGRRSPSDYRPPD